MPEEPSPALTPRASPRATIAFSRPSPLGDGRFLFSEVTPVTSRNSFGWDERLDTLFAPFRSEGHVPARVVRGDGARLQLALDADPSREPVTATLAGRLRHEALHASELPAVGDWVAASLLDDGGAVVHAVLPRKSAFGRKDPGRAVAEQMVAANVDIVFLVAGLDGEANPRKIERFLAAVWESGAAPAIALNKADACDDPEAWRARAESLAPGVPVHVVCALSGAGVAELAARIAPGATVAFVGASGVGKSTLVNALLGEERMDTGAVREDDKRGRHTTTRRELVPMPGGAWLLDTPGMRLLKIWGGEEGIEAVFADVVGFAAGCRFRDCAHDGEPGCGVRAALDDGRLSAERWRAWRKLERERVAFEVRHDVKLRAERASKWKKIAKAQRARTKLSPKR
jgi:ribosome biogenesis GTPase